MPHAGAIRSCLAVFLICSIASGCVVRPVYDESWAKQVRVESGACPVIDGEYQNAGEQGLRAKDKSKCDACGHSARSLARLLRIGYDYQLREDEVRLAPYIDDPSTYRYRSIRLQLADDTLRVEATHVDGSKETFDLPTRKQCRNSTMILKVSWDGTDAMGTEPFVNFVSRATLALGQAEDGSLLVRSGSTEVLFLLHLPLLLGTDADWTRFATVTP